MIPKQIIPHFITLLLVPLLPLLLCPTGAGADTGDSNLGQITQQIEDINDKLERLKKEEKSVLNDIYGIELKYDRARIENEKVLRQLNLKRGQINRKNEEKQSLEKDIEVSRKKMEKVLRILYKTGGNSFMKIFFRVDNLDQLFHNYRLFTSLVNYKKEEIEKLKVNVNRLNQVKKELELEYSDLKKLQALKQEKMRGVLNTKQARMQLIRGINTDRERHRRMLNELETEAVRLTEEIHGKTLKKRLVSIDLDALRGKLPWPLKGKTISSFGKKRSTKFNTYVINNGIKIKPRGNHQVRAVYPGEVIFANYYKGYGNLVIVQHARNFHTLYGYCERFLKKKDDNVDAGEVIAIAGDSGSTSGKALYFEIRNKLKPMDPLRWLQKKMR